MEECERRLATLAVARSSRERHIFMSKPHHVWRVLVPAGTRPPLSSSVNSDQRTRCILPPPTFLMVSNTRQQYAVGRCLSMSRLPTMEPPWSWTRAPFSRKFGTREACLGDGLTQAQAQRAQVMDRREVEHRAGPADSNDIEWKASETAEPAERGMRSRSATMLVHQACW